MLSPALSSAVTYVLSPALSSAVTYVLLPALSSAVTCCYQLWVLLSPGFGFCCHISAVTRIWVLLCCHHTLGSDATSVLSPTYFSLCRYTGVVTRLLVVPSHQSCHQVQVLTPHLCCHQTSGCAITSVPSPDFRLCCHISVVTRH